MNPTRFTAACIQMRSGRDVLKNRDDAVALIREAASQGADFAQTPEMTSLVCRDQAELFSKVGPEAQLISVTMRPTSIEFVVRDGKKAKGYRSDDGSTDLDSVGVNLYGPGTVVDSAFGIAKLDEAAPEKIAAAISRKESGDFNLTIATLERETNGNLLWDMKGTIDGRGVAYVADYNGKRVEIFNPVSPRQSSVPKGVTDIQDCIKAAKNDPAKLQACAQGIGG